MTLTFVAKGCLHPTKRDTTKSFLDKFRFCVSFVHDCLVSFAFFQSIFRGSVFIVNARGNSLALECCLFRDSFKT